VQIARSFGAHVTGVCSTRNVELVRSLGADQVIDYTRSDYTETEQRYDLIIDNVGNRSLLDNRRALAPKGKYILVGGGGPNDGRWIGPLARPLRALVLSQLVSQDLRMMLARLDAADLTAIGELMQAGKVTAVIDRRYRLEDVAAAMQYLEAGHARGKVVVTLEPGAETTRVAERPGVTAEPRTSPALIALGLIGTVAGVPLVPIAFAIALNRRFRKRNPDKRPFRWGYYFSIESFLAGVGLGVVLEAGALGVIACGLIYAVLAWFFARRQRWAWLALTIVSFNPIVWIINLVYLRKRWAEQ
jgi:hypothetical protein